MGRRTKGPDISGLLLVDKPTGISSFDVVAAVRRAYGTRKVGHTGTLDPMASGLLPIVLGRATRLSIYATNARKAYSAEVLLGQSTNTYDLEGEVTSRSDDALLNMLDHEKIVNAGKTFEGRIMQVPPAFSAIKIDGERAYSRARRGEDITLPPREVVIHHLEVTGVNGRVVSLNVDCSKGTYIRSLANDLGQTLGVGGTLSGLRRTKVGAWSIDDAIPLNQIVDGCDAERSAALHPIRAVVAEYAQLTLTVDEVRRVRNGQRFRIQAEPGMYCACGSDELMVALVDVDESHDLRVVRGIPPAIDVG